MIAAGWSELKSAFWQHVGVANENTTTSHNLLNFYAVECGLKAIYLKRNNLRTTDQISDDKIRGSHNLAVLIKELRLPASVTGTNSDFRLQKDKSSWSIDQLHQVWRYGIAVEPEDETKIVRWLNKLNGWVKENI